MGALTLKSFPFILRNWNVKSYQSFDPTDPFGQETKVYVNKNQVVKIEPQYSNPISNSWLTDKGRLFFDSFFVKSSIESSTYGPSSTEKFTQWGGLLKSLQKMFYVFNICNLKYADRFFFVLVFENVAIEIVNFLVLISQLNSFIKIKRAEKLRMYSNLESDFQINSSTVSGNLLASSLCLLISTNLRYEGSYLNLKLRQRYLKGNFKVLFLGSFVDLTFPVSYIGSNSGILKNFAEGTHVLCKDVVNSENPIFCTNTESLKHKTVQEVVNCFKTLNCLNILTDVWNGLNVLNSSIYETGLNSFSRFSFLTFKDLILFSSFYALNVNFHNVSNVRVVTESRLLKFKSVNKFLDKKVSIVQNISEVPGFALSKKYLYAPSSTFFENTNSFLNTEGFRKISAKLVFKKNTKSDWQILRKLVQNLDCFYDKKILFYDSSSLFNFKSFINFHFQATPHLINFNEFFVTSNPKFVLSKKFRCFALISHKFSSQNLQFWLRDFYLGGKDSFCQNSLNLVRCSSACRLGESTYNFFD